MASGDAVAPTAIDRPQCFIEKEKACFPCREFSCLSSCLLSWRRRMRDHNEWYNISIYVYIYLRRILFAVLFRGVMYIVSLLPIGC